MDAATQALSYLLSASGDVGTTEQTEKEEPDVFAHYDAETLGSDALYDIYG